MASGNKKPTGCLVGSGEVDGSGNLPHGGATGESETEGEKLRDDEKGKAEEKISRVMAGDSAEIDKIRQDFVKADCHKFA